MTPLERRIAKLEAMAKPTPRPVPHVLRVPFGHTIAAARAAFIAEYNPKPGFCVLTIPAKPATDAERALAAEQFKARQMALVAAARRERSAVVANKPAAPIAARNWPTVPTIRPNGPFVRWKPNHD